MALNDPRAKHPSSLMFSPINDGGPVHPTEGTWCPQGNGGTFYPGHSGLSLRDYFAGQALIGLIANNHVLENVPQFAYEVADAMIAARSGHGRPTGEA